MGLGFAPVIDTTNYTIQLDCRDLTYKYIPIQLGDYSFVLMNTNVKHSLASSAYNLRRIACEEGVAVVKQKYPSVQSLRDISIAMLDECMGDGARIVSTN